MDIKTLDSTNGSSFSLPFFTKTRRGSRVVIFAFFPQNSRPWIGAYSPHDNDSPSTEWVPMSWLKDGQFNSSEGPGGKPFVSGADCPELELKLKFVGG